MLRDRRGRDDACLFCCAYMTQHLPRTKRWMKRLLLRRTPSFVRCLLRTGSLPAAIGLRCYSDIGGMEGLRGDRDFTHAVRVCL